MGDKLFGEPPMSAEFERDNQAFESRENLRKYEERHGKIVTTEIAPTNVLNQIFEERNAALKEFRDNVLEYGYLEAKRIFDERTKKDGQE